MIRILTTITNKYSNNSNTIVTIVYNISNDVILIIAILRRKVFFAIRWHVSELQRSPSSSCSTRSRRDLPADFDAGSS